MGLGFDGSTQYCTLPALPAAVTGDITISCWIKQTATFSERDVIAYFQDGGSFAGWGLWSNSGNIAYYDGTATRTSTPANYQTGDWVHGGITAIGAAGTFWFNGITNGTWTAVAPTSYTGVGAIGSRAGGSAGTRWINGSLAEIAAWKCGLGPGDMWALSRGASPLSFRRDSLLLYVPMRLSEGVLPDVSKHGLPATVVAGPLTQDNHPIYLGRTKPPLKRRWLRAAAAGGGGGGIISGGGILSSRIFGSGMIRGVA